MITVSLGKACQVAHQLRRTGLGDGQTMFYDWLVTHHTELLKTLSLDFEDRLFRDGYSLPPAGVHLVENVTGLSFYSHDFPGLAEGDRAVSDDEVEAVRRKYVRRMKRTRGVLSSGGEVRIVRHFFEEPVETVVQRQADVVARLSELYPQTRFTYLWGSDFNTDELDSPFGDVHHLPQSETWLGNDEAWNRAVAGIKPRWLSRLFQKVRINASE